MRLKFPKSEKLKSRKLIEQLFSEGKSQTIYPIKLFFLERSELDNHQAAFAVPKRNFKLAVDRNRIKRQMREAYRLNKSVLNPNNSDNYALLFLYLGADTTPFEKLSEAMRNALKYLQK